MGEKDAARLTEREQMYLEMLAECRHAVQECHRARGHDGTSELAAQIDRELQANGLKPFPRCRAAMEPYSSYLVGMHAYSEMQHYSGCPGVEELEGTRRLRDLMREALKLRIVPLTGDARSAFLKLQVEMDRFDERMRRERVSPWRGVFMEKT